MKLSATERTRHRRLREQGRTDRAALFEVLAAGFVCHLGVVVESGPLAVPTVYGYDTERIYFHGSVASRSLAAGAQVCLTVTHVDGLVLSRSVFEHGVNYRSAMVLGVPEVLAGEAALGALQIITEHCAPGQWEYARQPSRKELAATTVLALSLAEASVKVRSGPPTDADCGDDDLPDGSPRWAGVLPLTVVPGALQPGPELPAGLTVPPHLSYLERR